MPPSNAIEPGAEFAFALESAELGNELDEHLLRDLLGILRMKDNADGNVVDPRLMPEDEFLQRTLSWPRRTL